jgi:hypothetical protein
MHAQLTYMTFQYRSAELRRAGEQARRATEVAARRRRWRDHNPITPPSAEPCRGTTALQVERTTGCPR